MSTQLFKSCIAVLMAALLTGCWGETKKDQPNDLDFETSEIDRTYYLLENPENPNCNLNIKFTYPTKYSDKTILGKIQNEFVLSYFGEAYAGLSPKEATEKYADDYIEAYKELEVDFKAELENSKGSPIGAWFGYFEMSENKIAYNRNNILSYTISFENYTGGAHGAHAYTNHVLNLKTGEPLTENDIFIEYFQDDLADLLINEIARQNNVSEPKELENMGFFSVEEIYPNGNFLVDETGITYSFNEYEIAAYVVGLINVHLSFEEVGKLLRPDSPIAHLINE